MGRMIVNLEEKYPLAKDIGYILSQMPSDSKLTAAFYDWNSNQFQLWIDTEMIENQPNTPISQTTYTPNDTGPDLVFRCSSMA